MSVNCALNSATLTVGNGTIYDYIYKTGYIWQNNAWSAFNYSGSNMDSSQNWFIGNANNTFSNIDPTEKQSVLAYICEVASVRFA